jgi:uncharacterized FlgJ-related protein
VWCAASVAIALCASLAASASAAGWGCYGTKPGHPTATERDAFIREVSALAVRAEAAHCVPASVLAAIAIAESGYGWTRLALDTNNLFAWKYVRSAAGGRKSYVHACQRGRLRRDRFMVFASRADAVDFVASRLAAAAAYRESTAAYKAARKRGDDAETAAKAWLHAVARRYSRKPAAFTKKVIRIMNNPAAPGDTVSPAANLYRLSAGAAR